MENAAFLHQTFLFLKANGGLTPDTFHGYATDVACKHRPSRPMPKGRLKMLKWHLQNLRWHLWSPGLYHFFSMRVI